MQRKILSVILSLLSTVAVSAQGNYVFSGGEAVNFGSMSLITSTSWATNRSASPGYFSAVGSGTYTNAAATNNVDGYVKYYASSSPASSFTFPVGTGSALFAISVSGLAANDVIAMAWIDGNPTTTTDPTSPAAGTHSITARGPGILSVSNKGQWDAQFLTISGSKTVTVTLPNSFALPANAAAEFSVFRLVGWDATQNLWVNLSGSTGATVSGSNFTISGTVSSSNITAITLGATTVALPLDLVDFKAQANECTAVLRWISANEENVNRFEIETSTNGSVYTLKNTVKAKGLGNNTYSTTIPQEQSLVYYRIKMIDNDGSFKYSPVRTVQTNCGQKGNYIRIYPNPVTTGSGQVTVSFYTDYRGGARFTVVNALGQKLVSQDIQITASTNVQQFMTDNLANGMYYILVTGNDNTELYKPQPFIKQ